MTCSFRLYFVESTFSSILMLNPYVITCNVVNKRSKKEQILNVILNSVFSLFKISGKQKGQTRLKMSANDPKRTLDDYI